MGQGVTSVVRLWEDAEPQRMSGPLSLGRAATSARGRIVELLAEVRLLVLGHRVARESVDDDGVDLILDRHLLLQVRSSQLHTVAASSLRPHRAFIFKRGKNGGWRADFYLFCGYEQIDAGFWWIVPGEVLRERGVGSSLTLFAEAGSGRSVEFAPYREAWHLLREGDADSA